MMGTLELSEMEVKEGCIDKMTDAERERCIKVLIRV